MEYSSTISFTTEYDPSITVVIRKPSYGERLDLDDRTQAYRTSLRKIGRRTAALDKQVAPDRRKFEAQNAAKIRTLKAALPKAPDAAAAQEGEPFSRAELEAQIADLQSLVFDEPLDVAFERDEATAEMLQVVARDYNPILLRWGVIEIQGLLIQGQPAGIEELLSSGPIDLVYEIKDQIERVMGLRGDELKNSSLPSISSAPADGKTSDTTVSAAASPDCTSLETADSSRPELSIPATR